MLFLIIFLQCHHQAIEFIYLRASVSAVEISREIHNFVRYFVSTFPKTTQILASSFINHAILTLFATTVVPIFRTIDKGQATCDRSTFARANSQDPRLPIHIVPQLIFRSFFHLFSLKFPFCRRMPLMYGIGPNLIRTNHATNNFTSARIRTSQCEKPILSAAQFASNDKYCQRQ